MKKSLRVLILFIFMLFLFGCNAKEEGFNITYKNYDGSTIMTNNVKKGEKLVLPEPDRDGYIFQGWYIGEEKIDENILIDKDLVLESHWSIEEIQENPEEMKTYNVTFKYNNGSKDLIQKIKENGLVQNVKKPTKKGYSFSGWYWNNKQYNFKSPVKSNIVLVGKWTKNNTNSASKTEKVEEVKPIEGSKNEQETIVKEITTELIENVAIKYSIKEEKEVNLLRNKKVVVQVGKNGLKEIKYLVTSNSEGKELSRSKVSEKVIEEPITQIVKVGISDVNLNTDISYGIWEPTIYLHEDVEEFYLTAEPDYHFCAEFAGYVAEGEALVIKTTNGYVESDVLVWKQSGGIKRLMKHNKELYRGEQIDVIYMDGSKYYACRNRGGEGGTELVTEAECNTYGLACGRW